MNLADIKIKKLKLYKETIKKIAVEVKASAKQKYTNALHAIWKYLRGISLLWNSGKKKKTNIQK